MKRRIFIPLAGAILISVGYFLLSRSCPTTRQADVPIRDETPQQLGASASEMVNAHSMQPTPPHGTTRNPPINGDISSNEALLKRIRESWSHEGLEVTHHPDGSKTLNTSGRFIHVAVAQAGPDGKVDIICAAEPTAIASNNDQDASLHAER